ncbi:hypothetical protein EZV62_003768 [Acer yangbiense]|uniref:Uncharacterized protein n=1 Tax=Acer yangbiense TaxID=1000413 RepID=A0A5C7IHW5_9ROSI|nr:hypothetical protein EZV62_003768 [Acer yangbiense]
MWHCCEGNDSSMCFDNEMKAPRVTEDRLKLLRRMTGEFRPGVLTAVMGVSGWMF